MSISRVRELECSVYFASWDAAEAALNELATQGQYIVLFESTLLAVLSNEERAGLRNKSFGATIGSTIGAARLGAVSLSNHGGEPSGA